MKTRVNTLMVLGLCSVGVATIGGLLALPMQHWLDGPQVSEQSAQQPKPSITKTPFQFPPVEIATGSSVHVPNSQPQASSKTLPNLPGGETTGSRGIPQETLQAEQRQADQLLELAESLLEISQPKLPPSLGANLDTDSELLADNPLANLSLSSQKLPDLPNSELHQPKLTQRLPDQPWSQQAPSIPPNTAELAQNNVQPLEIQLSQTLPDLELLPSDGSDSELPSAQNDVPVLEEDLIASFASRPADSKQPRAQQPPIELWNPNAGDAHVAANETGSTPNSITTGPAKDLDLAQSGVFAGELTSEPLAVEPGETATSRTDRVSPGGSRLKVQTISQPKQSLTDDSTHRQLPAEDTTTTIPERPLEPGAISFPHQLAIQLDETAAAFPQLSGWAVEYKSLTRELCAAGVTHRRVALEQLEIHRIQLESLTNQSDQLRRHSQIKQLCYALDRRLDFWQAVVPGNPILAQRQQQVERQIHLARSRRWNFDNVQITDDWASYLLWPELKEVINNSLQSSTDKQYWAREILTRVNSGTLDFQQESVIAKLLPLDLQKQLYHHAKIQVERAEILAAIEAYEASGSAEASMKIMEGFRWLRLSEDAADQQMVDLIENHYRNANFRLTASREFINRWFVSQTWVNQTIARQKKNHVGIGVMPFLLELIPTDSGFHFQLTPSGQQQGTSDGWVPTAPAEPAKDDPDVIAISFQSDEEAPPIPPGYFQQTAVAGGNYQGIPFADWIIKNYPGGMTIKAHEIAIKNEAQSQSQLANELSQQLSQRLKKTQTAIERTLHGFLLAGLAPKVIENRNTATAITTRFRVADNTQLASHTARPNPTQQSLLSLQIHQSFINNALPRIQVAGRTFTWSSLSQHLADVGSLPATALAQNLSNDQFTFAEHQALEVFFDDQRISIVMRLQQATINQRSYGPITIQYDLAPVTDGCQLAVQPVWEQPLTIVDSDLSVGERRQLTDYLQGLITDSEICLTPHDWHKDPLAGQLTIAQCELTDGWLSISVEARNRPRTIALTQAEEESNGGAATKVPAQNPTQDREATDPSPKANLFRSVLVENVYQLGPAERAAESPAPRPLRERPTKSLPVPVIDFNSALGLLPQPQSTPVAAPEGRDNASLPILRSVLE